jgi:DNA-binding NarL/FixJ family response regulator
VPDVLIASDSAHVREEVKAVLGGRDVTVREVSSGVDVLAAAQEHLPDLVVCDLQIGNMGGMATCLELRLEESGGRLGHVPVLMLLDRRPDVFLARRSEADGWIVKPVDPIRLRRAIAALLDGGTYEDASYAPVSVEVPAPPSAPSASASASGT